MKGKPAGKTRRVVAWMNKAEYDHVLEHMYSRDPVLQKHALHRISAWKGRCAISLSLIKYLSISVETWNVSKDQFDKLQKLSNVVNSVAFRCNVNCVRNDFDLLSVS